MQPTPYADVNTILSDLLARVQVILGDNFVGMYLYGSLATNTFDPDSSDIDFLVATRNEVEEAVFRQLQAMHAELGQADSKWAIQLEGAYISLPELRRYSERKHPHIDRGESDLLMKPFHTDWVVQRYVLREYGITMVGPPIRDLIDPISGDDLRQAMVDMMAVWWELMLDDPAPLDSDGYRAYAIMTMCRVLYTMETGDILPKGAAVEWAIKRLDDEHARLAKLAGANRNGTPQITISDVQKMIRLAVDACQRWQTS